jgi:hypothetical protein
MYWTNDELMDFRMAFAVYCGYGIDISEARFAELENKAFW